MNYFKMKLIILSVYISITFYDAYGGVQRDINAEEICTHKNCVETLEKANRSREKNYLDHYIDTFNELYNEQGSEKYEKNIALFVKGCVTRPVSLLKKDIIIMFTCDILLKIHALIELQNTSTYCDNEKNNVYYNERDGIEMCKRELEQIGFTFKNGLDNYVFMKLKLQRKESLTSLQENYIEYLTIEINTYSTDTKKSEILSNTTKWCNLWECESDLYKDGFKNRMDGKKNNVVVQTKYEGHCDEIESSTSKDYCNYLKDNGKDPNFALYSTLEWCMWSFKPFK